MQVLASVWRGRAYLLCSSSYDALAWSRCWHEERAFRAGLFAVCGALARMQHRARGRAATR